MEITYEYRHFHGTSFDSRTVSDVQAVECLINLLSKFMASQLVNLRHHPRLPSSSCRHLLRSYPHEIQDRNCSNNRNREARPTSGERLVQASDSRAISTLPISPNYLRYQRTKLCIGAVYKQGWMRVHTRATARPWGNDHSAWKSNK